MAQAVSPWPLTAEVQVRSKFCPREICGRQSDTGTAFSPRTSVFPCQFHSTNAPYSSSSTRCSYQKDKWTKSEKRSFVIWRALDRKDSHLWPSKGYWCLRLPCPYCSPFNNGPYLPWQLWLFATGSSSCRHVPTWTQSSVRCSATVMRQRVPRQSV